MISSNMRKKLHYLLFAAVLLGVAWLSYWIGYINSQHQLSADSFDILEQETPQKLPHFIKPKTDKSQILLRNPDKDGHGGANGLAGDRAKDNEYNYDDEGEGKQNHDQLIKGDGDDSDQKQDEKLLYEDDNKDKGGDNKIPYAKDKKENNVFNSRKGKLKIPDLELDEEEDMEAKANKENNQKKDADNYDIYVKVPKQLQIEKQRNWEESQRIQSTSRPKLTLPPNDFDDDDPFYTLIHGGHAAKVHGQIHANLSSMETYINKEAYIFTTRRFPKDPRLRPSVGNGLLGTAIHASSIYMDGVYNGAGNDSHRAAIPSTCSFNISGTEPPSNSTRRYRLNIGEGIFSEILISRHYQITQRIYAHRNCTNLIVVEVDLVRSGPMTPLKLQIRLNKWRPSYDITFFKAESGMDEVSYKHGHINAPEAESSEITTVHMFYDHVPDMLIPPLGSPRTKWVFLTSIGRTKDEALTAYLKGTSLVKTNDQLYADHVRSWSQLWARGRVDIIGNLVTARAVYSALYYTLSSVPSTPKEKSPFIGISPTGLPFGEKEEDYRGHIFWDQELWIFPSLLLLHSDIGRIILDTRLRTVEAAKKNALLNKHKGIQYPWESALTGAEVCDDSKYSTQELHITGDVSWAILQYFYATNDKVFIKFEGFGEILKNIADFWMSTLTYNHTLQQFTILGVMPPDEHHWNVNNSVYTNSIAKLALNAPFLADRSVNKNVTVNRWKQHADDIYIPFDKKKNYHPEFDGYKPGTKIKQADTVLVGYPLLRQMSREVRKNDLLMYEKVTDLQGPAMTWAMHTIGWLEVKDIKRAETDFKRNFNYIKNEFQVWQEKSYGDGATNFITGMGGFLQSVINGYGGIRLHSNRLDLDPILPPDCAGLHLVGVDYLGNTLDLYFQEKEVMVMLQGRTQTAVPLKVYLYNPEEVHSLQLFQSVRFKPRKASIISAKISLEELFAEY